MSSTIKENGFSVKEFKKVANKNEQSTISIRWSEWHFELEFRRSPSTYVNTVYTWPNTDRGLIAV